MVQINWTPLARFDLKEIFDYISRDSKRYAQYQVIRLKARTNILKKAPRAGKVIREISEENFRELVEGNYRILYKIVDDNRIDIIAIHHAARDLKRRFGN